MSNFRSALLFAALGFLLASLAGSLRAAPDKTFGMALMSASVGDDGAVDVGAGVVSSQRLSTGTYNVHFNRKLAGCTCTASFGSVEGLFFFGGPATITSNCPYTSGDDVIVYTTQGAPASSAVDAPFH